MSHPAIPALFPVVGHHLTAPLVGGGEVPYVHLDYAASAPCLAAVAEAVDELLPWYSSVHRGAGFTSTACTELLAAARDTVRRFVVGRHDDTVVFTRNTTDGLNLLAAALPSTTRVVTFDSEHHANLLPWRRLQAVHLPAPRTPAAALADLAAALRHLPAGGPRLVAVTGAGNVTGEVWPLAALAEVAHRHGARIVVDAAQLAPHRALDLAGDDLDYVALSGHKLYAPFGAGALVGRPDWLDTGRPYLAGGGAVRRVTTDGVEWAAGHARHEGGTPNLVGAAALAVACRTLAETGFDRIHRHEAALADRLRQGLAAIAGVRLAELWPGADRIGVLTLTLDGWDPSLLAAALSAEHGIGVRDGSFCAHPLVGRLGVGAGGAVRVSFGVGSSSDDVDRFLTALAQLAGHGPAARYHCVEGRWQPVDDDRARPALLTRLVGAASQAAAREAPPCLAAALL